MSARVKSTRSVFVIIHRYIGLITAIFLIIAGITGSIITFYDELDSYINHSIFFVLKQDKLLIDPLALRNKLLLDYPNAKIHYVDLEVKHGKTIKVYLDPKSDLDRFLPNDELYANPYTGDVVGARLWGDVSQGLKNLMPFIFRLHYSLALKGLGIIFFGIIALLWTIDCFIGAYLTFPPKHKSVTSHKLSDWKSRWVKSWTIRWHAGFYKKLFDLHRAGGLWLWSMVFIFAWSSVGFNLQTVYSPVMRTVFTFNDADSRLPKASPSSSPPIDFIQAREYGRELAKQAELKYHFKVLNETSINYNQNDGVYRYIVKTSNDDNSKSGRTRFYIDAHSGVLRHLETPSLEKSGDIVTNWLSWIHTAHVFGLPMKLFVMFMGISITTLSITGVCIWYKKFKARKFSDKRLKVAKLNQVKTTNNKTSNQ